MVIAEQKRNDSDEYKNIFQVCGDLVKSETKIACTAANMYDTVNEKYDNRKLMWVMLIAIPICIFMGVVFSACIKYLFF